MLLAEETNCMAEESYESLMKPAHERFSLWPTAKAHCEESWQVPDRPPVDISSSPVVAAHDSETRQLRSDILDRIYVNTPVFFEHLIIDVLLRMG